MQNLDPAQLIFVGTGEAVDPTLPNTSLLVRGPRTILLDCGYAVPHALWRITQDVDELDAIWISHTHADHVFGLPALLLWMRLGGRTRPLTLLCGPGQAAKLEQVLELGYPGSFAAHKCYPVAFVELALGSTNHFHEFELRIAASAHSVVNYALRLEAPGLRSLVYSGDGAPTPSTRALCEGASVLVHECFFASSTPGTGSRKHGDLETCLALAQTAGVRTLALLHFASDAKPAILERAASSSDADLELILPAPGATLALAEPGNPT